MHKKVMPRYATCDISGRKEIPLTVVVDEEAPRPVGSAGVEGASLLAAQGSFEACLNL